MGFVKKKEKEYRGEIRKIMDRSVARPPMNGVRRKIEAKAMVGQHFVPGSIKFKQHFKKKKPY
jgi:hypothetical protein